MKKIWTSLLLSGIVANIPVGTSIASSKPAACIFTYNVYCNGSQIGASSGYAPTCSEAREFAKMGVRAMSC